MGWTYPYTTQTRAELVDYLRRPDRFGNFELVKSSARGNRHWYLVRNKSTGEHSIGLDLMKGSRDGWGYKDIDESCGPHYFDVPLSYLDAAPALTAGYSATWRESVRQWHAERKQVKKAAPGCRVRLSDGREYTLQRSLGRRGWIVLDQWGYDWRMPCKQLARAERVAA